MIEKGKPNELARRNPVADVVRLRGGDVLKRPGASPLKRSEKALSPREREKQQPQAEPLRAKVTNRDVKVIGGDADEVAGALAALTIPKLDRPDTRVHVVGLDASVSNNYVKAVAEKHAVSSGEIDPNKLYTKIADPQLAADIFISSLPDHQNQDPRKVEKNIVRDIIQTITATDPSRETPGPSLTKISDAMLFLMKDRRSMDKLTESQMHGLLDVFESRLDSPGFQDMVGVLHAHAHEQTSAPVKGSIVTGEDPRFMHYALQGNGSTPEDQISMLTRTLVHRLTSDEGDISVVQGASGLTEVRMHPIVVIPRADKLDPEKYKKITDPLYETGADVYSTFPHITDEMHFQPGTTLVFMHSPKGPDATKIADLIGQEKQEQREQSYNSGGHKDTSSHKDYNKGKGKNLGSEGGKNKNSGSSWGTGESKGNSWGATVNHREQWEHVVAPEEFQHLLRGTGIVFEGGTLAPFDLQQEGALVPTTPFRDQLANLFPGEHPTQMTEAEYRRSLGVGMQRNYPFGASWRERKAVDADNEAMQQRFMERHSEHIREVQAMLERNDFRGEDFISPAGTFTAPAGRMSDHRREVLRAFRDQPIGVQYSVLSRMAQDIRSAEYNMVRARAIDKANLDRQKQEGLKTTAVPATEVPNRRQIAPQDRKAIGQ